MPTAFFESLAWREAVFTFERVVPLTSAGVS